MMALRHRLERFAPTQLPVLIVGERGVGKDVLAHYIHQGAQTHNGVFVKVSCAAAPSTLLSSELLQKLARQPVETRSPGAGSSHESNHVTVFFEDVFDLDAELQSTLCGLIRHEESKGRDDRQREAQFRLICATRRDPEAEVARGTFRQDLYSEISVVRIDLPPLRQRRSDIPLLLEYFLKRFCGEYGCTATPLKTQVVEAATRRAWPENIRELENAVRRYVVLDSDQMLAGDAGSCSTRETANEDLSLKARTRQAVRDTERQLILETLRANNWNRKDAARKLKISYRSMMYKLKAAGVPPKRRHLQDSPE
jgi:two-component system, NtrC family, response regulator AtoC